MVGPEAAGELAVPGASVDSAICLAGAASTAGVTTAAGAATSAVLTVGFAETCPSVLVGFCLVGTDRTAFGAPTSPAFSCEDGPR